MKLEVYCHNVEDKPDRVVGDVLRKLEDLDYKIQEGCSKNCTRKNKK